jgi:hypothetical protein
METERKLGKREKHRVKIKLKKKKEQVKANCAVLFSITKTYTNLPIKIYIRYVFAFDPSLKHLNKAHKIPVL